MTSYVLHYAHNGALISCRGSREKISIILNKVRKTADKGSIKVKMLNSQKDVTKTFKV